jgi:hypothetical protein
LGRLQLDKQSSPKRSAHISPKFILSNKIARTCIFVYTIVIHMLLYVILYKFGNVTDCKSHLGEMFAERFGEPVEL